MRSAGDYPNEFAAAAEADPLALVEVDLDVDDAGEPLPADPLAADLEVQAQAELADELAGVDLEEDDDNDELRAAAHADRGERP